MTKLKSLENQFQKTQRDQEEIKLKFKTLLNKDSLSFDERLILWEKSAGDLKIHYPKIPATKNKMIINVLKRSRNRLCESGRKIELRIALMDDLYIYHHDEYAEAFDSESNLKTKKDFITFMEYVMQHNMASFESP